IKRGNHLLTLVLRGSGVNGRTCRSNNYVLGECSRLT
ncbi:unnamed protein product, partial [Allacma fusca]